MKTKYITFLLYFMAGPISILIFCDFIIFKNNIYLILHIILSIIYFLLFYLFIKYIQNEPIELTSDSIIIPSAPPVILLASTTVV